MNPVKLTIDKREVTVPADSTVLEACRQLNIDIPTLCYQNGYDHFTSCMVCVVFDAGAGRLIPSCSAVVAERMQIETENAKVKEARKDALDFLLSEHVGDCSAPCQRACPAHMDIPLMNRQIAENRLQEAIVTVKADIALPAVLGRICPAPCEKGCHRRSHDSPVSICALKRFVADVDLSRSTAYRPAVKPDTGKKVAVVGAGPAGLSAAYYLLQEGHACFVYDRNPLPGGELRYGVSDEVLPKSVLDAEIERIADLGAAFRMEHYLGRDLDWGELRENHDAVVLTVGTTKPELFEGTGIKLSNRGILVDRRTFQTSIPGVFAGGNVLSPARMAIRAAAHGKEIAFSVSRFLSQGAAEDAEQSFQSILNKVNPEEALQFLKEAEESGRVAMEGGSEKRYSDAEAKKESSRCFGCDCRKADSCRLRRYSAEYGADMRRYTFVERKPFQKDVRHELVVYEPGKCIKCGLCVQITAKAGEKLGLTFVGRGFDVRVGVPFGEALSRGLEKVAGECVRACPTAALSWRDRTKNEK